MHIMCNFETCGSFVLINSRQLSKLLYCRKLPSRIRHRVPRLNPDFRGEKEQNKKKSRNRSCQGPLAVGLLFVRSARGWRGDAEGRHSHGWDSHDAADAFSQLPTCVYRRASGTAFFVIARRCPLAVSQSARKHFAVCPSALLWTFRRRGPTRNVK